MDIPLLLQNCYKELVASLPFSKITVADICEACGISRTTFYACYEDKHNLLEHIVEADIIDPIRHLRELLPTREVESAPQLLGDSVYRGIYESRDFYAALSKVDKGRLLTDLITSKIMLLNDEILHTYSLPDVEKRYMSFFYAASNAVLIVEWIKNDYDIPYETISGYFNKWSRRYWSDFACE